MFVVVVVVKKYFLNLSTLARLWITQFTPLAFSTRFNPTTPTKYSIPSNAFDHVASFSSRAISSLVNFGNNTLRISSKLLSKISTFSGREYARPFSKCMNTRWFSRSNACVYAGVFEPRPAKN